MRPTGTAADGWADAQAEHNVKKQPDLVVPQREWSCSYAQLETFVTSCGVLLVALKAGVDDLLVEQARTLEHLGLIALERDGSRWVVVDGDIYDDAWRDRRTRTERLEARRNTLGT